MVFEVHTFSWGRGFNDVLFYYGKARHKDLNIQPLEHP